MDISGTYTLNAPREQVWDALFDPETLKRAVPGCESIERTGADEYAMRLHVDVAGTRGSYDGSLRVLEAQKPEGYRLVVDGTGARGILHGDGRLRLETNDAGATVVTYSGQAQLGGAIASIGVGVARTAAQHLIQDFFGRLQQALPASVAATVAPAVTAATPGAAATGAAATGAAATGAAPVATTAAPSADAFAAPAAPANAPVDALLPRTAPIIPPPAPPSPQPAPPAEALAASPASAAPAPAVSPATEAPAATATAAAGNGATAMPQAAPPSVSSATPARRIGITDGSVEDGKRAARTIWAGITIAIVVVAVVILYIITR
jgi:uncharacterized protein